MIDPPLSSNVTVVVGDSLTLSCNSQGSPPDTFTWMKDGTVLDPQPNIVTLAHDNTAANFQTNYTISNVITSDSGTYTCTVTNPIGSDSENITVVVVTGELILLHLSTVLANVNGIEVKHSTFSLLFWSLKFFFLKKHF